MRTEGDEEDEPPLEEISHGRWSAPWGVRVLSRPAVGGNATMMTTDRQAGDRIDMRIEGYRSKCPRMLPNLRSGRMIESLGDLRNLGHFCVSGEDVEMRVFIPRAQPSRMDDPC